jgi:transposase InsO family protein
MRSLFYDVTRTVRVTVERSNFSVHRTLSILGISKSWYYDQMYFTPILDGRFNPYAINNEDERLIIGYRLSHPRMNFRELSYAMIDDDYAYLSSSSVYRILKKHDLITGWKRMPWTPSKPIRATLPDERWQTDIMYVKVKERFFYLVIFIDEYSRYIVHHALLTSMDSNSVSLEAQRAIESLRRDSLATPVIQSDNGSAFISMEFRIVLKENSLTHKKIHPHTPEQNGIVERANKTVRESISDKIITDFGDAEVEIAKVIHWYNYERRHSSLQYLTPMQYYRGNPVELLNIRESKIERARIMRKEKNMRERKGGEVAGTVS